MPNMTISIRLVSIQITTKFGSWTFASDNWPQGDNCSQKKLTCMTDNYAAYTVDLEILSAKNIHLKNFAVV